MRTFTKGIYWHDCVTKDEEQLDLTIQVIKPTTENGIFFTNPIECREYPNCLEESFDVLFFDWGGMSLGNSLMEHFCRHILKDAENNPNRFYVMVSLFTSEAMQDAMKEFGKDIPFNIHLSIDDFSDWLKKYEEGK